MQIINIKNSIAQAISEDLGTSGDITSEYLINTNHNTSFTVVIKEDAIVCGINIAEYILDNYSNLQYEMCAKDGQYISTNNIIIKGHGKAIEILRLERVILNYLQHLSGIATLTNKYVLETKNTKAKVYDTRKTTPGLRTLQKYAVRCGGGNNHRYTLDSSILIKDNHLSIHGNIRKAISKIKSNAPLNVKIEIECSNIEQVKEALSCDIDIIMLDNMNLKQITSAIQLINNQVITEVSGNVNLQNIKQIAQTGVDIISIGRITHSAPAIDISMNLFNQGDIQ